MNIVISSEGRDVETYRQGQIMATLNPRWGLDKDGRPVDLFNLSRIATHFAETCKTEEEAIKGAVLFVQEKARIVDGSVVETTEKFRLLVVSEFRRLRAPTSVSPVSKEAILLPV